MRILIIANTSWYLYKFRYNLIQALIQRGDVICIACPDDNYSQQMVAELGVHWHPIPSTPRRVVPYKELSLVYRLFNACKQFKPDACLTYTPRVNCYISLVPWLTKKTKLIRNISGLGDSLSSGRKFQTMLAKFLYQRSQDSYWTFYQNEEDMNVGISQSFSRPDNTSLLPGSGVDLDRFQYRDRKAAPPFRILLAARLIPVKGYLDYIELAKRYRSNAALEFHLAGTFSDESGVTKQEFDTLLKDAGVVYHGYTEDLTPLYDQSDMFILPSTYGEGLPRVLLEAAACGCLLLAYDNPGSNRAIQQGINGWILTDKSVAAMQERMDTYLALTHEQRQTMSKASRQHVENGFSETEVINAYLELLH